jgi:hypothetical protein
MPRTTRELLDIAINHVDGDVVWTSWAHYSGGYQDRLLGGPLGLLDLCYTVLVGVEPKDYRGIVLG